MSGTTAPQQLLVLGGGQLGRMLGEAAARLDVRVTVIDPTSGCPAATTTDRHVLASFRDAEAIRAVTEAELPDLATVEIEDVSTEALRELRERGVPVHPSPELLDTIKDKLAQRNALAAAGLPGPRYVEVGPDLSAAAPIVSAEAQFLNRRKADGARGGAQIRSHLDVARSG